MCLVDDDLDMPSSIYDLIGGNKTRFSGVLLGENIINTLSRSSFVDNTAGLFMFLSANNQHKMVNCPYIWK